MPYRRNTRRRKPYRKRKQRRYRRRTTIGRVKPTLPGFPSSRVVKMRYCDQVGLDPSAGGNVASYVYRANSVYDPQNPVGGHQPIGFDIWEQLYNHYLVLGSKITCQFVAGDVNVNDPYVCGAFTSDDSVFSTANFTTLIEQGLSSYTVLQPSSNGNLPRRKAFYSPRKFFAIKDIADNAARLGSAVSGNPDEMAYFVLWAAALDQSTNVGAIRALITIEYTVLFAEPKHQAQSAV